MITSRFCSHCGAANALSNAHCYACQQPLEALADTPDIPHLETPADPLLPASTLLNERYTVLTEIGAGGFGAVYRARDTREHNRTVAIKQINLKGLSPQEIIEATDAFNREAQILTTLNHPLLPRIFDRFSDPEHWYLVMNFIDGVTLDEYLQQHVAKALPARAGLPLAETLTIALHLCDVLHYLHIQQPPVIFRDIKPGNIMRTAAGRLYLIDFGIARHFKPGQAKDTVPFGSPGFAAPEQYGRAQTTPQADIYSLGALLYCLISGDDPADHPFQFPSLRLHGIDGIRELDALIQRMVALDATQRPVDIAEVRADLQAIEHIHAQANTQHIWLPPQGQTPPDPSTFRQQQIFSSTSPKQAHPKTSRRRVITAALGIGGAALIGGIATTLGQYNSIYQADQDPFSDTTSSTAQSDQATATAQVAAVPLNGPTYWSPDLNYAAVANLVQNQIELYPVPSQQSQLNIPLPKHFLSPTIQWSLNNKSILAQTETGLIQAWDATNGQTLFTFTSAVAAKTANPYGDIITVWSPNGQYCAISYQDTNDPRNTVLTIIRAKDGSSILQKDIPAIGTLAWSPSTPAWSPDSRYLAFPTTAHWLANMSWSAQIWDRYTSQIATSFGGVVPATATYAYYDISSIAWSPSGKYIATVLNYDVWITDTTNNQTALVLQNALYSPVWSPDETFLATLSVGNLTIWNIASGQVVSLNETDAQGNLAAFAWSKDSHSVTVVDNSNVISQWSLD